MKQKITLKMIADRLGMTTATISKALAEKPDISVETRKKVRALADELGYRPNLIARSLVKNRSFMLGVIVPDLRISFFAKVARGMYEKARSLGYTPILLVNDDDEQNERDNLQFLSSLPVDGILLDAAPGTMNRGLIGQIHDQGIPFVCYDRSLGDMDFPSVTVDDRQAATDVVRYFADHGRRNIVYLGPTEGMSIAGARYRGYCDGLAECGIPFRHELVIDCPLDDQETQEVCANILWNGDVAPDAVLCVGGLIAYGAGRAILNAGLSIPGDIMLAEFGDNDIVSRLGVPFLTVDQSPYEMGKVAVEQIIGIIENNGAEYSRNITIPTSLRARNVG